jgi:capsular polysaccharide biosynthesis protein
VPGAVTVVVAASLLIAAIAYVVGSALPAVYQSSGLVRVVVLSQQGRTDVVVTAENDTATQLVQLAGSQPVLDSAAASLGASSGSLSGKITASTLGAQNLVQVQATGDSRASARERAKAATLALADYVGGLNAQTAAQYLGTVQSALGSISRQISATYARISKDSAVLRAADTLQLGTLLASRSQVIGQVARDAASNQTSLQVVSDSGAPSVVYPKPSLYALVAFIAGLILVGRLGFMAMSRRRS